MCGCRMPSIILLYSLLSSHLCYEYRGLNLRIEEEGFSNLDEVNNDTQVIDVSRDSNMSRFVALFLLNAKEHQQLTQSSLDLVTHGIHSGYYVILVWITRSNCNAEILH